MANNYLQQAKEIMEGKTSVRVLGYGKFAVPEFFTLYKDNIESIVKTIKLITESIILKTGNVITAIN